MKYINIMNFARSYEPRDSETEKNLLKTTKEQLDLVNARMRRRNRLEGENVLLGVVQRRDDDLAQRRRDLLFV